MTIFKCKMCGGNLQIEQGKTVGECDSCGTKQTLPKLDSDRRAQLYDRANHFRRNNDYDKAAGIYETILNEDNADAEAYWSLVLCKYGVEYVEDHKTKKRVITCNRTLMTSVMADEDYKQAITHADGSQRSIYEDEARAIEQIQKGILEISSYDEPYDVFICYKETDAGGKRTRESVTAQELYHELTEEGFRVFFSRITLENVLGAAYEPHIFAALNSSKVMVVVGSSPENFNAVWVKNEWSRYLALIKGGAKKVLIPAYRDMDAYDLPDEFSHLQAQDMSKLGFMQDLVRGIKKVIEIDDPKPEVAEPVIVTAPVGSIDALLKRANLFLEDGDFAQADTYFNRVLDAEPENAEAYVGLLCAELKLKCAEDLSNHHRPLHDYGNYKKAVRFSSAKNKAVLEGYNQTILDQLEKARLAEEERQRQLAEWKKRDEAARLERQRLAEKEQRLLFEKQKKERKIRNKKRLRVACVVVVIVAIVSTAVILVAQGIARANRREETILLAERLVSEKKYIDAENVLLSLNNSNNPSVSECLHTVYSEAAQEAERLASEKKYVEAAGILASLHPVMNHFSDEEISLINSEVANMVDLLLQEGDYKEVANILTPLANSRSYLIIERLVNLLNILRPTINPALMSAGENHSLGLKPDGTVMAVGNNDDSQCYVSEFENIIGVSAGNYYSAVLDSSGDVDRTLTVNSTTYIRGFDDIVAMSVGSNHTIGLGKYGRVLSEGSDLYGLDDVWRWSDVIAVEAGHYYSLGLLENGLVVAVGNNDFGQCDISQWSDIVAISAGWNHSVGLKSDGSVVSVGNNKQGQCNVSEWFNIVSISGGENHTVGLKSDGTVIAVGDNRNGQCNVSDWRGIVAISAGGQHTLGLRADGTMVAVGNNEFGQCDVSDWDLID